MQPSFASKVIVPLSSDLILVHSSDLHLGINHHHSDDLHGLRLELDAARAVSADVLLLAGDVFDHNRVPLEYIDRAARLISDVGLPTVILPGNHDGLTPNSVYRRGGLADPSNVHVLGISVNKTVAFSDHDLEIWGRPHLNHTGYSPLRNPRPPRLAFPRRGDRRHWRGIRRARPLGPRLAGG